MQRIIYKRKTKQNKYIKENKQSIQKQNNLSEHYYHLSDKTKKLKHGIQNKTKKWDGHGRPKPEKNSDQRARLQKIMKNFRLIKMKKNRSFRKLSLSTSTSQICISNKEKIIKTKAK